MGYIVFGYDQASARFFIEPMNNAGPGITGDSAEFTGAMMQEGVDQGVLAMTSAEAPVLASVAVATAVPPALPARPST